MDRLTNRIAIPERENDLIVFTKGKYDDTIPAEMTHDDIRAVLRRLAEYEDLEEQGLMLRLPLKIGDTVYFLGRKCDKCEEDYCYRCPYNLNGEKRDDIFVYDMVVKQFRIYNNSVYIVDTDAVWSSSEISLNIKQFGKTVFLTKAEAEQKLKEMERD